MEINKLPPEQPLDFAAFASQCSREDFLRLYRSLLTIRIFEETIKNSLEQEKIIRTPCHLCIGQEATCVGVCDCLEDRDRVFGNHRSHGHYLAKGGNLEKAMSEIFCREDGCSGGRGGSMHLVSPEKGVMGTSSIVSGSVPLAVGAGLASAIRKSGEISVSFHGDGVPEEGAWNESANFAAVNKLPVLFVCENNLYSTHQPLEERRVRDNLCELAAAHGLRTVSVDGNNVLAVRAAAHEAVDSLRRGEGPVFLECRTYRWLGHVGPKDDLQVGLRSLPEVEAWKKRCPIANFEKFLLDGLHAPKESLDSIRHEVNRRVNTALVVAKAQKQPAPQTLLHHVYFRRHAAVAHQPEPARGERKLRYVDAIREAQEVALARDWNTYIIGQGVDNPWCVGSSTKGLLERFGKARVRDVPISEYGMTGAAIGSAMCGLKPLVFHPRMDFMYLALDQIFNHCAFWNYMFDGQVHVPVVIRGIINRRGEQGAQHSQSPYAMYAHAPGLKIALPATAYDAKGLLLAAFEDGNPVLFLDDRALYDETDEVPEGFYTIPFGIGKVLREGTDVTIVAISCLVPQALKAAAELARNGVSAEVIDPRTIKPLDMQLIVKSAGRTGRLVIADPAWPRCGVAADISAQANEKLFGKLKAPVKCVTFPDTPMPAAFSLEEAYYPDYTDIVECVKTLFQSQA